MTATALSVAASAVAIATSSAMVRPTMPTNATHHPTGRDARADFIRGAAAAFERGGGAS